MKKIAIEDGTVLRFLPTLVGDTFRLGLPFGFIGAKPVRRPIYQFPRNSPIFQEMWRLSREQMFGSRMPVRAGREARPPADWDYDIGVRFLVSAVPDGPDPRLGLVDVGRQLAQKLSERFGADMGCRVDPETFACADCLVVVKRIVTNYIPTFDKSRFEDRGPWPLGPVADFVRQNQDDLDYWADDELARDTPHREAIDLITGGLASSAVAALRQKALGEILEHA
jgi:hypothetical protein